MSVPAKKLTVSVEDYLSAEKASQIKHEYVNGQIHAMGGGTLAHNQICMNIAIFFRSNTKGSICRTFMSDVKVHIEQHNSFYYPDVLVACGAFDPNSYFVNEPLLIVELLSPSTSDTDRRERLAAYRTLHSVRDYLIVYQDRIRVEVFSKDSESAWIQRIVEDAGENILLSSFNGELILPLSTIYEGLALGV